MLATTAGGYSGTGMGGARRLAPMRAARGCCSCLLLLVALFGCWFIYTGFAVNWERVGGCAGMMATATAEAERNVPVQPPPASPPPPFARTPLGPGPTPTTVVTVKVLTPAR